MNDHALTVLQLPETLALVAGYASSPLGAEAVRALTPSDAPAWIEPELRRVNQMVGFLLRVDDWALPALPDLRGPLRKLAVEGSVWEPVALRDCALLLRGARETRRVVLQHADHFPLLAEIAELLISREDLEEVIRAAIDDAGEVRDSASRELARLRREIRGARSRIVAKLEQYMQSLPSRFQVADASVTIRDGRYVVPVRREARVEVGGLVHDESATGATLFVEPPVALELMNRLRELEIAEAREVQRILRELTDRLRPHRAELKAALEALVVLDSLFARARYALEVNGTRPEMLPAGTAEYHVVRGYHPLLRATGVDVVPFDLRMEDDERTLLVSGPNTGGKTVLLKAVGLISALTQCGVIPPVGEGTRLPLFTDIFADIGDEQSIEASLSTFAAHLVNLREILESATAQSLVLIDEMGSGTDPAEGGALAQAILVDLTRRGTFTVATTHLGQLKLLAGEEPGVVNASLQFDAAELRPTYRLQKGVPGRSYGLAIAKRLGFPGPLLERADEYLPAAERDVSHLLLELEEKERALAASLAETRVARADAMSLRTQLEHRESELRRREQDAERRARQQARDLLLSAREDVESAISEMRAAAAAAATSAEFEEAIRSARRRVEQRAQKQAERMPDDVPAAPARREAQDLEVGARVRIAATGADGVVVELRDGRAVVETGGVRLQVATRGLEVLQPQPVQPTSRSQQRGGWIAPDVDASPEVDLRGMRADEAVVVLTRALDNAILAGLPSLRIIHGKGTGALREVVTDVLKGERRVQAFRPGGMGEGGAGVTVADLA